MLRNYFTVALRNLSRNQMYVLLNILGLSVGMILLIWGYLTWRFTFSWDDFHAQREQIFRAVVVREGNDALKGVCPLPVAEMARRDFASITESARWYQRGCDIKGAQMEPFSEQVHFTDPAFLNMFNFPLLRGNNDLNDRNAVLLTEKTAEKYFGKDDPLGKTLELYAGEKLSAPLVVRGVLKDLPLNSSFRFGILTNFENLKTSDTSYVKPDDWTMFVNATVFKIPNTADAQGLEEAFKKYLPQQNAARPDWKVSNFRLLPFTVLADKYSNTMEADNLIDRPDDSAGYGPLITALLIFLSACLNFANTTVARSNRRLREMGVRKALGGGRAQLMWQILLECAVIVAVAVLLAMALCNWWMDTFNAMFDGINARADFLRDMPLLGFLGTLFVFTTLLAGAYPAFYISNFNASQIFRGGVRFGGTNLFSRVLLGFQVMVSLITVICGIAFARNGAFQKDYDYGYDRVGLLGVRLPDQRSFEAFRDAIKDLPEVTATAGTRHHIGFVYRTPTAEAEGQKMEVNFFEVGDHYVETMGLKVATGRAFDLTREADFRYSALISQKTAMEFGWNETTALGKQIRIDTVNYSVIGVLHNFHQDHLFQPIRPQVVRLARPDRYQNLIVRTKPEHLESVQKQLKAKWAQTFPLKTFNSYYQDEVGAEAYKVTSSIASIFSWFAIAAILLSATGLFALVSLTVLKKMKEIALRKVAGARPLQIMAIVNHSYVWIFAVATVAGCVGGWFMTRFLMDSIFKVNIGVEPLTLALASLALFGISALTVGFKVRQAVNANPAEVLRSE